jgi:hypothetical protein
MSFKVFDLSCEASHVFEGWFASQDEFDAQLRESRIECPMCGSLTIQRLPSAPRLNLGASVPAPRSAPTGPERGRLQAMFVQAARHLAATTEDVGERFAEEARRIHYKEAPERGIRGLASREEAEALIEEGVKVVAVPFGDLLKETLQ